MPNALNPLIHIEVMDRFGRKLPGAEVRFYDGDSPRGTVLTGAGGTAQLQLTGIKDRIRVTVAYGTLRDEVTLAKNATSYRFTLQTGSPPMSEYVAPILGIILIALGVYLAFAFEDPSLLQQRIILGVMALGAGAVASAIPGMLRIKLSLGQQVVVGAAGAVAVLVLFYFFDPLQTIDPNDLLDPGAEAPEAG